MSTEPELSEGSPPLPARRLRIAVLGLGLIGGSCAQAWRTAGHHLTGWSRRASTVEAAVARGIVDQGAATAQDAVRGAEVVVLAPPVLSFRPLLTDIAPALRTGAIVTDVASTKAAPERWATAALPPHARWVGSHPMAGREVSGLDHVDPDLFRGRTWVVVPPADADPDAVATVSHLGRALGSRVIEMTADAHDEAVANVSHLPFVASTVLSQAVIGDVRFDAWSCVAATGLRDLTRLASGDALMHRDICVTNRDRIAAAMDRFAEVFASMAANLRALPEPEDAEGSDPMAAIEAAFVLAKSDRDAWLPNAR